MTGPAPLAVGQPGALGRGAISACIVARNEEAVIERCLRSLADCVDEIILVHDGRCDDRTLDIARDFGAKTIIGRDTGVQEYHEVTAFSHAVGEWLLKIDADEFLSPELRQEIPFLVARDDVNGYALLWRVWDGTRYITSEGPFKLALFRRRSVHIRGVLHYPVRVDEPTERVMLGLEHRPLYNNFSLSAFLSKHRRWARIHARQLVQSGAEIPTFNLDRMDEWPIWRRAMNWLSPLLIVPYGLVNGAVAFREGREYYSLRMNARLAAHIGVYNAMLMAYVARYRYLGVRT